MIKIFRHIRKQLLSKNRFSKYLVYAIGEIVLVVIGILIALQINNWNEATKLILKEENIAKEIHFELVQNIASVSTQLKLWKDRNKVLFKLSDVISFENLTLSNREFDSLMLYVVSYNNFKLKTSKFNKIVASDNFEFKKSKKITTEMLSLNDSYKTLIAYYEFNVTNAEDNLKPYLIKNYILGNFNNFRNKKKYIKSTNYRVLLSDVEFNNIINSAIGNNAPFVKNIERSIKEMEKFQEILETTYPAIKANND